MSVRSRLDEILATISAAYGNLDEPNYAFAAVRLRKLRHHPVIGDLMSRYFVLDETDLNDHVAIHLRVLHGEGSCVLCLSLVDSWAMLFRLAHESRVYEKIIEPFCPAALSAELHIAELLQGHGFKLLTKGEAAWPVAMNLFNTDREESRIYHAVIADDGIVPDVLLR